MLDNLKKWIYYTVLDQLVEEDFAHLLEDAIKRQILDDDLFITKLYSVLEHERQLREIMAENARKAKIDLALQKACEENLQRKKERQDNCPHLKGQRGGKGSTVTPDYNIWCHTFPDDRITVRCLICSKEWSGEELKSEEVQFMLKNTTNSPSASEVNLGTRRNGKWISPIIDRKEPEHAEPGSAELYDGLKPFVTSGYIKFWDKMYKKLTRKRKKAS